ncbi:RNA-directed DNA polymerase, eukaryota [Tanacetum coccineum]
MLGSELQGEDFAKKMVDLVNQRKKYFAEERAKAKRNKPMTQSQLKTYMMNYLKNQGTWKLSQLKNLSFEEVKEEFDKLVKQVESFAPINFEATKASLKRFGEELQTKTPKRLKDDEAKDDEPTKKSGKRRKQKGAKEENATNLDKDDSEDSDEVVSKKSLSQVISRDDLTELYRIVMNRYGMDGPEDELEKLIDDSILSKEKVTTRWVKVTPIKINEFAWIVRLDKLPVRLNLSLRGIDISTIVCPLCHVFVESGSHIFFSCLMAHHLWRKLMRWWELEDIDLASYDDWLLWLNSSWLSKRLKDILEGVCYVKWWLIWRFRNKLLFGTTNPRRELLFDDLFQYSFN